MVTVLFCDLVGFTGRAERLDPEDVRALQATYWAAVRGELERFGGTVEKFIGEAARRLIAEGRRPEGEEQLRLALAFFRSVGASARIREGEALLALPA